MNSQPTIDLMRITAQALRSGDVRDKLRALQALQDAADAAKAMLLAELETSRDYELDGASTINAWVHPQPDAAGRTCQPRRAQVHRPQSADVLHVHQ